MITTANNEKYQCFIPEIIDEEVIQEEPYSGLNPIELLYLLFNQNTCSYRVCIIYFQIINM
jgi:endoplasmic reticulum lectin 1